MEIDSTTFRTAIYIALYIAITFIQRMAFRSPGWRAREFGRRAIGIGTVLVFALLFVADGQADAMTWGLFVGLFVLGGAVKAAGDWYDSMRHAALGRTDSYGEEADC